MKLYHSKIFQAAITMLLVQLLSSSVYAQLPTCDLLYLDQYTIVNGPIESTLKIYNYDPSLPPTATNPTLNTIALPHINALGLTVSEVLNSGNPTLTFYTVISDKYWYYNPTTLTWINTNHTTGGIGAAFNIASGGGFIYNLDGLSGNVYKYDGTGNGTFLLTVPNFINEGPWDLIVDCQGNLYILNVTGTNGPASFRKYSPTGVLLQTWTINNPNNYFATNPGGFTAGFGIVNNKVYVDNFNYLPQGGGSIATGSIVGNTLDFTSTSATITQYQAGTFIGDFGSCSSGISDFSEISIAAPFTTICIGTTVTFTSNITSTGTNPTYQWFVNGVPINGATDSTFNYAPADNDEITCTLFTNSPCSLVSTTTSNSITMEVADDIPAVIQYVSDSFCKEILLTQPSFSPAGGSFTASPSGIIINGNTGEIDLSASETGTYVIEYATSPNEICPVRRGYATISILPTPSSEITVELPEKLCVNDTLTLNAAEVPGYIYEWTPFKYFGTNNFKPQVTAKLALNSLIYLTVTSKEGCRSSDSILLRPEHCCNVMIPTAFSPNGDGNNDVFEIYSAAPQQIILLSVYNRWGERVFSSSNQSIGWDGTYKNKPADIGAYYYYVTYSCSNGKIIEDKGDVTLIR